LLFIVIGKFRRTFVLPILLILASASLAGFFWSHDAAERFYLMQFRFFELALGGVCAILLGQRLLNHSWSAVLLIALVVLLSVDIPLLPPKFVLVLTVFVTLAIIVSANERSGITSFILENRLVVGIGAISYSLYMWHQLVLSYTRYTLVQQ